MSLEETAHVQADPLVTGEFDEANDYRNWRSAGTRDWLLIYTIEGRGRFGHMEGELITPAGHAVLIRPGTRHDYGTAPRQGRWRLIWAHFQPRAEWLEWMDWPEAAGGLMVLRVPGSVNRMRILERFRDTDRLTQSARPHATDLAMNALEEVLLRLHSTDPRSHRAPLDARLRRTLDYIRDHLAEALRVAVLARIAGLSPSRFAHAFRDEVGMSPRQFVEHRRMERARQLLDFTSMLVQDVAFAVGFESPFYFSLRFKQHVGQSPRAYRRRTVRGQGAGIRGQEA